MKDRDFVLVCAAQALSLAVLEAGLCAAPFLLVSLGARSDAALAGWSGAAQAAACGLSVIAIPFWGRLGDRFGRARMLARAQLGLAASLVLLAAARAPWQVVLARGLQGALAGGTPAALALVAGGADGARRIGWVQSATLGGAVAGPLLGGLLLPRTGAPALLLGGAALALALAAAAWTIAEPREAVRRAASGEAPARGFAGAAAFSFFRSLEDPLLPVIARSLAPGHWPALAGACLSLSRALQAASAPAWGRLCGRFGGTRVFRYAALGAGLATASQAVAPTGASLLAARAVLGLFAAGGAAACRRRRRGPAPRRGRGLDRQRTAPGRRLGRRRSRRTGRRGRRARRARARGGRRRSVPIHFPSRPTSGGRFMRRSLFDWHLILGYASGALIIVWSLSGAAMIMDPVMRRGLDPKLPKAPLAALPLADFLFPASRLAADGAASVSLRHFAGRSWYEARWTDGKVKTFDSRTGAPVEGEVTPAEARDAAVKAVAGRWTAGEPYRLEKHDDQYRSGELPVIAVPLTGPSNPVYYFSVRDGSLVKSTTLWSRVFRWLGLGIHTWNLAAFKSAADDLRRWSLTLFICLPLIVMSLVAYALVYLRRRAAAPKRLAPARRAGAALVALSLLAAVPGEATVRALGRVVIAAAGPLAGPRVLPRASLTPDAPSVALSAPSLLETPSVAVPVLRLAASAASPAATSAPAAAAAVFAIAPAPPAADAPAEAASAEAAARFDGLLARTAAPGDAVFAAADGPALPGLAPASPAPRRGDRKALIGIYTTHAAHLATMSVAWRVAWPLLALDLAGKAGLATVGSVGALVEMGTGLLAGALVDRFLPRRSLAAAALARAAIAVTLAFAAQGTGLPFLLGAFVAHSFALTTIHIGQSAAAPVAAGGEPGALRKVNATLKIITAAVSIPGSLAGGFLVASMGIPGTLLAYAAANIVVLAPLYLWLFPVGAATSKPVASAPDSAVKPADAKAKGSLWGAMKLVLTSRILMGTLIAMAAGVVLVEPLRSTVLPILASELSPATAAILLGGFQAAYYAGQFAGNLALLRWGKKLSDRAWLLVGAAGLAAFSLFLMASTHVAFGFAAAALIGLLSQPVSVVAKTMFQEEVRRLRPDLLGRAMGVNNVFYRLAVSAGTALVGWASVAGAALALGATGTLAAAYGLVGVLLVVAVLFLLKRPSAPREPSEGKTTGLGGFAPAGLLLGFSALEWHMTLGAVTGLLVLWMAVTGAVTIAGPLLKKKLDPKLPDFPAQEGFAALTVSLAEAERVLAAARPQFRPVSAVARRGAGVIRHRSSDRQALWPRWTGARVRSWTRSSRMRTRARPSTAGCRVRLGASPRSPCSFAPTTSSTARGNFRPIAYASRVPAPTTPSSRRAMASPWTLCRVSRASSVGRASACTRSASGCSSRNTTPFGAWRCRC